MQAFITNTEKEDLKLLVAPKGRVLWFRKENEVSYNTLRRLKTEGQADEAIVKRVRAFLKRKDVAKLIEQAREAKAVAA